MKFAIMAFALEAQETATVEGLQRATVVIPSRATVLHLGTVPGSDVIALYALAPKPPIGPNGQELPYDARELRTMEFVVTGVGMEIPPAGYKFRAPVRTRDPATGIEGLIFLFEKETVVVLGSRP